MDKNQIKLEIEKLSQGDDRLARLYNALPKAFKKQVQTHVELGMRPQLHQVLNNTVLRYVSLINQEAPKTHKNSEEYKSYLKIQEILKEIDDMEDAWDEYK